MPTNNRSEAWRVDAPVCRRVAEKRQAEMQFRPQPLPCRCAGGYCGVTPRYEELPFTRSQRGKTNGKKADCDLRIECAGTVLVVLIDVPMMVDVCFFCLAIYGAYRLGRP